MLTKFEMKRMLEHLFEDLDIIDYHPSRDETEYILWVERRNDFMPDIHIYCTPQKDNYIVQLGWREEELGEYYQDKKEARREEDVIRIIDAFFNYRRSAQPLNLEKFKNEEKKEEYKADTEDGVEQLRLF